MLSEVEMMIVVGKSVSGDGEVLGDDIYISDWCCFSEYRLLWVCKLQ